MSDHATMVGTKSSFSGDQGGACVEVADLGHGGRALRDSKNPAGGMLSVSSGAFAAFVKGARDGDFD